MENIFLFGASGHARVVLDILELKQKYHVDCFLDDDQLLHNREFMNIPVVGGSDLLGDDRIAAMQGLITIGDNASRMSIYELLQSAGHSLINAIHPSVIIAESVQLGAGIVIMAGGIINPGTSIGDNTIINTAATVDHDCMVGSHVHIAPGCHVCGHVQLGDGVLMGAGSTIVPMVNIGEGAVIGAGATVTEDVKAGATVVGTPARAINNNQAHHHE